MLGGRREGRAEGTSEQEIRSQISRRTILHGFVLRANGALTMSTFGLFAIPVALALDVPSVAAAFGLFSLTSGVCAPLVGFLVDRIGLRLVQRLGAGSLVLGLLGSALASTDWQFSISMGLLCGIGVTAFTQLPVNVLVTRWVTGRLLPAFGIVTSGAGVGALLAVPLTERVIAGGNWRLAYIGYAVVTAVMWWAFDRWATRAAESRAAVEQSDNTENVDVGSTVTRKPRLTRAEVQMSLASFFSGAQRTVMVAFFIPWAVARGVEVASAARVFAVSEGLRAFSGVVLSWLGGRFGPRVTYSVTTATAMLSVLALQRMDDPAQGPLLSLAALYGLASGAIHPASSSLQSSVYHRSRVGLLFGASSAGYGVGGAIFVALAGLVQRTSGVGGVLWLVAVGLGVMSLLVIGLGRIDDARAVGR